MSSLITGEGNGKMRVRWGGGNRYHQSTMAGEWRNIGVDARLYHMKHKDTYYVNLIIPQHHIVPDYKVKSPHGLFRIQPSWKQVKNMGGLHLARPGADKVQKVMLIKLTPQDAQKVKAGTHYIVDFHIMKEGITRSKTYLVPKAQLPINILNKRPKPGYNKVMIGGKEHILYI